MAEEHVQEFTAQRTEFGVMSGHFGGEGWTTDAEAGRPGSVGGPSLEGIVGRRLGTGSRVKVTVEVISEEPVTVNPWHQPDEEGHRWRTIHTCLDCKAEVAGQL